jgi:hypothetical protein
MHDAVRFSFFQARNGAGLGVSCRRPDADAERATWLRRCRRGRWRRRRLPPAMKYYSIVSNLYNLY